MKKTRFTEEQMVTILREADEKSVPEVAKKHGVSAQTIYGWRKHYGTLEPADVKRLRQLEQENGRLKKLVADGTVALQIDQKRLTHMDSPVVCDASLKDICPSLISVSACLPRHDSGRASTAAAIPSAVITKR